MNDEIELEGKEAAYYVNERAEFILVVTADEKEIFQPVDRVTTYGTMGLILAYVICSTIATLYVIFSIIRPIMKVQSLTEKIANMDFTESEIQAKLNKRKDEIGQMSKSFGILREKLVEVATGIRGECDALVEAADALAIGADNTANAMSQVENAVMDIARGATGQASETQTASENVYHIGDMVRDASETNRLSLNASIEAVRAGEQGCGFAVVASEIQKLADQSTASAMRIEEIINVLLRDSEEAVSTMAYVKKILGEQTVCIQSTDKAFVDVETGIAEAMKGIHVIADKTKEMDKARVNVVDGVNNLTAIAEENASSTEETSALSQKYPPLYLISQHRQEI